MGAQLVAAAVGMWLMAAPAVLDYGGAAAVVDRIVGPLAATVGGMAASEVLRSVRRVNLPLGLALLVVPWVLGYPWNALLNSLGCGLVLVACSAIGGSRRHRTGGGWKVLFARR